MDLDFIYDNMNLKKYQEKFDILQSIIGKQAQTIIEIGGHYGEDTLRFHKFFPQAHIYSFEPDPRNITIFKRTCQYINNITLIQKAASDTEGRQTFYQLFNKNNEHILDDKYKYIGHETYNELNLSGSGASSLKKSQQPELNIYDTITVDTIRLDEWVKSNHVTSIDFLWIDVQGAESNVISGCRDIINMIKFVQLEYGETDYVDGLTKGSTYQMMINNGFELILDYNKFSSKGDFLFQNKKFSE